MASAPQISSSSLQGSTALCYTSFFTILLPFQSSSCYILIFLCNPLVFFCQFPERESHHRVGCTSIPWHRKATLGSLSPQGSPVTYLGHWLPTLSMLALDITDVHKRWATK